MFKVEQVGCKICYPEISTCITITGVGPSGLVGTHITIDTTAQEVDSIFHHIGTLGAKFYQNFRVIGAIADFKKRTVDQSINTRKKIRDKIKSSINQNAIVKFYDTSNNSHVVNVLVEKQGNNINFNWNQGNGNVVAGPVYPAFNNLNLINPAQFVTR